MWTPWKKPEPAPVVVRADPPKVTGMRISQEALAYARTPTKTARHPYTVAVPPPGVLPDNVPSMAMDDSISTAYTYAASNWDGLDDVCWPGYAFLSQLAQRPEYRRMSEIRAQEMTRKWVRLHSVGKDDISERITAIDLELKRLKVQDLFRRAIELDGLFGRAQIYIDTGDSDNLDELKTPLALNKGKIGKGKLKRLSIVEPIWTYPNDYNSTEPLKPGFYKPRSWYVNGKLVDGTRLLTIVSREMPDMLKPAYSFGGLSLSQMAMPYVENWLRTRQSVSDLLHSFSTMVLATDLDSMMAVGAAQNLMMRTSMFNANRDNSGLMVTNKQTEELTNVTTPLGGLDALQAQAQEQMCSISATPSVKLLGITPSGLNSSSEGEIRVFYDSMEATFEEICSDPLRTIINIVQLSLFGDIDPNVDFSFEPLWSLDDAAKATLRKTNADTASAYIADGVLSPIDERARLAAEDGGLYNGLDVDDLPDPPDPASEGPPGPDDDGAEEGNGEAEPQADPGLAPGAEPVAKPAADIAMDAAQVATMLDVIGKVGSGELSLETAYTILSRALALDEATCQDLLAGVVPGGNKVSLPIAADKAIEAPAESPTTIALAKGMVDIIGSVSQMAAAIESKSAPVITVNVPPANVTVPISAAIDASRAVTKTVISERLPDGTIVSKVTEA